MQQTLIVTQLDQSAMQWIEAEAKRTGKAVDDVVRKLIYRGLEIEGKQAKRQCYHDLDSLAGTWSADDVTEFNQTIVDLNQIDPNLWQ